ncbi:MAG: hypothetical protein NZ651_07050, partial [Candidatus Bipolaricaulota bacterium]|nr:hypothetical protein [Candidatus Bipolaricaulota bacterium]MDW8127510.1 hypothetical protein [Candidatus Bipolaricaulota bacterium]
EALGKLPCREFAEATEARDEHSWHRGKWFSEEVVAEEGIEARTLIRREDEVLSTVDAGGRGLVRPPFLEILDEPSESFGRAVMRPFTFRIGTQEEFSQTLSEYLARRVRALSTFHLEEIAEALEKSKFGFMRLLRDYYEAERNIQDGLLHYDRGKEAIRAFLSPAAQELERLAAALVATWDQLFLETAEGAALDAIGARWGLRRGEGQTDREFRERIRLEIYICLSSGTTDQIKDIVCRWFNLRPGIVEINRNFSVLYNIHRDAFYEIRLPVDVLFDPKAPKWFRFAQKEEPVLKSEHGFDRGRFKHPVDMWNWRFVYELDKLLDRITAAGVEWLIAAYNGFRFSLDPLVPTEDSDRGFNRGKLVGGVFGPLNKR